ncbi:MULTISPECIES: DUF2796 domain-containing protein [Roseobacteraceae]|uniref:DUF2796 domain-containing protein n=1 Tax=Celeribacter baekdonensis B30 TaxID=1208323 RepID=K2ITB4_9RHOB|nr:MULTISPECIES: DUF2796 domain-containing protein [Roseobacteraceae]EKE73511.1 hypothetical protein B30_05592 [Celeribacter baekdonensis B30]KAB6717575.1 DUF2796 domain-containing protein [Roseobacter sp. TSBP12]|tara:strand:- start:438 stop:1049 length:612 start_codon:yes stop_codon:yes gene_type:complete
MKPIRFALLASLTAAPLWAQETREMDAHVHGVSTLELAVEGEIIEMNLMSPGMDLVGFEYAASTDADKDKVEAAIRTLLLPENVIALPKAAGCRLTEVLAHLHAGDHDDDHDDDQDDDHDQDAATEAHSHDDGDDHAHTEGAAHSEFHARYIFACAQPQELTTLGFPFFERFENAHEIEAHYVTATGAGAAEINRSVAKLTLD